MRGLLGFLVFVAVLIAVFAAFAVPAFVAPMVSTAVRDASPLGDEPLDVQADINALGLIRGFVSEIRVSGTNLSRDEVSIESFSVKVHNVGIGDHEFDRIEGTLGNVSIPLADGTRLVVHDVALSGSSTDLVATAHLDRAAAVSFVEHAFADQGVAATAVELTSSGISVVVFEQRVELAVGVADGALVIPDLLGTGPFEILTPQPGDAWRLTGATVTPNGMDLDASVDVSGVLAGG